MANAQLAAKPVLATALNGIWTYTLQIQITDNNPAAVPFTARLASGAHLFGGSSLQIKSSAGNLQIHNALPVAGAPDLALSLSGPSTTVEGGTVSYSLIYTNKASAYGASGVQVNQTLPVEILINPVTLPANARLVGNTLFWDLGNLSPKANGKLTFNATVAASAAIGANLVVASQIVSAENDQNMLDNEASITTTVVCGGVTPSIVSEPASASGCPGDPIELSVSAVGPSGLTYQWSKDGVVLAGATNGTYTIGGLRSLDLGTYTVTVMSPCGDVASQPAVVSVNPESPVKIQGQAFQADGSFALEFGTGCGGSYIVEYTSDFVVWKQSPVTVPGQQGTARWVDAGPPATETKPDAQSHRCYRILRSF